ncbi:MAG: N-acetyltransferase, partial [Anaerolineaceae bacterium]
MPQTNVSLYDQCPTYESERFLYRLVQPEDAQDLLECYADPESAKIFNSDNCTSNFIYHTRD